MSEPEPLAIHGKAIDRAMADDRAWFLARPGRRFRLRPVLPFEYNGPLGPPPPGFVFYTILLQVEPGVRPKHLIPVPAKLFTPESCEALTDDELEPCFRNSLNPYFLPLIDTLLAASKAGGVSHDGPKDA